MSGSGGDHHDHHDSCGDHRHDQKKIVDSIGYAYVSVVFILSGFVIFTYMKFQSLRTRSFEMVFMLAISDLCSNISYIINPKPETGNVPCRIQGFLLQFFTLATVGWTLLIAWTLDLLVVQSKPLPNFALCFTVIWGLALVGAMMPLVWSISDQRHKSHDVYGRAPGEDYCWINDQNNSVSLWKYALFYIPCGATMVIVSVYYGRVYRMVHRYMKLGGNNPRLLRLIRALKWYPIVFIVAWVPQFCIWLITTITGRETCESKKLVIANHLGRGSFFQAVGHSLVYGLNSSVKDAWRSQLGRVSDYPLCARLKAIFGLSQVELRNTIDDLVPPSPDEFRAFQSEASSIEAPSLYSIHSNSASSQVELGFSLENPKSTSSGKSVTFKMSTAGSEN